MSKQKIAGYILLSVFIILVVILTFLKSIPQDPAYHNFADERSLAAIPNTFDVLSNLPFLIVAVLGFLLKPKGPTSVILLSGIFLTGLGSAWYHANPSNTSLIWDRLPMTVLFMSFYILILKRTGIIIREKTWLTVFICTGVFSVWYWFITESHGTGDLRPYVVVQFFPLVTLPILLFIFRTDKLFLKSGLLISACYVVAKVFETYDEQIYTLLSETVSGHTLKHLASALATYFMLPLIEKKKSHE